MFDSRMKNRFAVCGALLVCLVAACEPRKTEVVTIPAAPPAALPTPVDSKKLPLVGPAEATPTEKIAPACTVTARVGTFVLGLKKKQVDILVVADNSPSAKPLLGRFASFVAGVVEPIRGVEGVDARVMVVAAGPVLYGDGRGAEPGVALPVQAKLPWINLAEARAREDLWARYFPPLADVDKRHSASQALLAALEQHARKGRRNAGFHRPGAALLVVIPAIFDDPHPAPEQAAERLRKLAGGPLEVIIASGFTAGPMAELMPADCGAGGTVIQSGYRWKRFAIATGGSVANACGDGNEPEQWMAFPCAQVKPPAEP
ncbi:MAG: hypothetical protein GMKNLPBB_02299 [Myxococcota bacterium]|nr:hypothetical protein [Myxococcota bacterium]